MSVNQYFNSGYYTVEKPYKYPENEIICPILLCKTNTASCPICGIMFTSYDHTLTDIVCSYCNTKRIPLIQKCIRNYLKRIK